MPIRAQLLALRDEKYKAFQAALIPNIDPDTIVGVRMPILKKLAKQLVKAGQAEQFTNDLPHKYYDENILHALIFGELKLTYEEISARIEKFLPYVDNWAVCDTIRAKALMQDPAKAYELILAWLKTNETYKTRFALVCMLNYFLDDYFSPAHLNLIQTIQNDDYYVRMAIAWYLSYALIKQYDATLPLIESHALPTWIHRKTIQKAIESFRIPPDRKNYLKTLR